MTDADRRTFLESVRPLVVWFARRTARRGEAEDLAQESLLRVWQGCHQFAGGSASAWLRAVVRSAAGELARRRERAAQFPIDTDGRVMEPTDPDGIEPLDGLVEAEETIRLGAAVAELPDRERRVIGMRYGGSVTLAEAGATLGVSGVRAGQVEARAVVRLRDVLTTDPRFEKAKRAGG